MITGAPIVRKVTQRATSCHHQWYLFLIHCIIQLSIHLIYPRLVSSHPALHRTLLVITVALISRTVTKRAMSCHHQWNLWLLHWMIQSLIHLSCTWFVNIHPNLYITQHKSFKLLQYPVGLHLIPSNTMPPPSTNNGSRNIYGCMVGVSKLTPAQRQQHSVMLLQHHHYLCNTNDPSSIFLSPPPMTNIELLS